MQRYAILFDNGNFIIEVMFLQWQALTDVRACKEYLSSNL